MKSDNTILVAIHCLVYNHEPYLRDCLNGFVMQKTKFRYVAIVHDDFSKDKSAEIIREYAEKYPDIIKPIFETENQWSKHDGAINRIMNEAIAESHAKYVAMCEGDDYWIDPLKLQKQVDFLESNSEFGVVFTAGYNLQNGKLIPHGPAMGPYHNGDMSEICLNYTIGYAASLVYKEELLQYINLEELHTNGIHLYDYLRYAIFSMHTKFAFLEDRTMVYRIENSSLSHSPYNVGYVENVAKIRRYLQRKYPDLCHFDMEEVNDMVSYTRLKRALLDGNYKDAIQAKAELKTSKYKSKCYTKMLRGRLSFGVLNLQMKIRALLNID